MGVHWAKDTGLPLLRAKINICKELHKSLDLFYYYNFCVKKSGKKKRKKKKRVGKVPIKSASHLLAAINCI